MTDDEYCRRWMRMASPLPMRCLVTRPTTTLSFQTLQALGKLTYALNPSHRFTLDPHGASSAKRRFEPVRHLPAERSTGISTDSNGGTVESSVTGSRTTAHSTRPCVWTAESPKKNVTVQSLAACTSIRVLLPRMGLPSVPCWRRISRVGQRSSGPSLATTSPIWDPNLKIPAMCQDTVRDPATMALTVRNLVRSAAVQFKRSWPAGRRRPTTVTS